MLSRLGLQWCLLSRMCSCRTTLQAFPDTTPGAKLLGRAVKMFYAAADLTKDLLRHEAFTVTHAHMDTL